MSLRPTLFARAGGGSGAAAIRGLRKCAGCLNLFASFAPQYRLMRRHWFLWLIVLVYAGYLLWPQLRAAVGLGARVGAQVPAFQVQDLDGNAHDSRAMPGQVVLINFWATWCPPCRTEMPGFEQVYRAMHGRGFEILAISLDNGSPEAVEQFATELELTFPIVAGHARVARAFDGANVVPTSYLIDRQGRIRRKVVGMLNHQDLEAAVDTLLREPAATAAAD